MVRKAQIDPNASLEAERAGTDGLVGAALVLAIGFLEANSTQAINMLCDGAGLARSEANAKIALKRLAVRDIRRQELLEAAQEAEAKPLPE